MVTNHAPAPGRNLPGAGSVGLVKKGGAMRRILLAVRVFFATLFSGAVADRVGQVLAGQPLQPSGGRSAAPAAKPGKPTGPPPPRRSEALTLLATLQREARLIDFLMEPLENYSDAQIGAAVRDVHRDCAKVLNRMFAPRPIVGQHEGATVTVPVGFDAGRFRLTGNVIGEPPFSGQMMHHGWEAGHCELPEWSGGHAAARVIAPVEVELA
jgi:hypothetical protein